MNKVVWVIGCGMALLASVAPVPACSLCEGQGFVQSPTFRQEAALPTARLILHGTVANPMLSNDGKGGKTDFTIKTILREDKAVKAPAKLILDRYLPVDDAKSPPHYLLFCDVDGKKVDPYRGVPLKGGTKTVDYVKEALKLDTKKPTDSLAFFFARLDDADPEVARDAFLEFAKAADADILAAASKMSATKLRGWLDDPKTPTVCLNVYALLLGACGKEADAKYLRELLDSKEERYTAAADGILAGYIQLKPKEGWEMLHTILADGRKPLLQRLGVLRTLRFFHGAQPKQTRPQLVKAMKVLLAQGDMADLAIEDLRRYEVWDLTDEVLKRYGQKGYDAPLIKRAIIRYTLCCKPTETTKAFLTTRRADDRELVDEVEEFLKLERQK